MRCKKTCPICNKEFIADAPNTVYCSEECKQNSTPELRFRNQTVFPKKKCPICNKMFTANTNHRKYCVNCEKEGKRRRNLEYLHNREIRRKYESSKKKQYAIEEINRKALAEHLSYGKYVAKYGL